MDAENREEMDFKLWIKTDEQMAGIKAATGMALPELRKSFNSRKSLDLSAHTDAQLATSARCGVDPKWVNAEGRLMFPPNYGFEAGTPAQGEADLWLQPGQLLDRYGKASGKFFCPFGTPFEQRSLPPSEAGTGHLAYQVLRQFPVRAGRAVPWFGYPGGGFQYRTAVLGGARQLLEEGFLKIVQIQQQQKAAAQTNVGGKESIKEAKSHLVNKKW